MIDSIIGSVLIVVGILLIDEGSFRIFNRNTDKSFFVIEHPVYKNEKTEEKNSDEETEIGTFESSSTTTTNE